MYRIFIVLIISLLTQGLNAQYDFRSLPMKTDFGTRYHGNTSFSDGTYAAIGILEDGINNTSEMVLTKFDCQGQIQWAKTLGGAIGVNNTNGGIAEAENGDMVIAYSLATGWFNATMLVARYTQEGERVWAKRIGLSSEYARAVTPTQDGGFVVVGSTGTFGVDGLRADIYMIKLDANGEIMWAKTLGNNDAYDDAYNVSEASNGDLLVTGRYIVDGTFYHFFLKTDSEGTEKVFKGYGGPLHRNFGFDVRETPEGDYLMTGYTTLAKDDFMSRGDCFLMKVDDQGDIIWANVYEPTERDNNDFGFSIVFEDDGDYGICLESSSFSAIGGPQAPNKNVIYTTDSDGNLKRVILLNPKGSQYTKMSKAADGGYFITGFSTYYIASSTAPFNGFGFKTDPDYSSGECEEYDRTNRVVTTQVPWDVQDISGEERNGVRVADYAVENDWAFDSAWIICSRIPEIFVEIMPFPDSVCAGESIMLGGNPQGGITDYTWDLGSGDTLMGQQVDYAYDTAGSFQIILTASDGCQTVYDTQQIVVTRGETFDISRQLCPGDTLVFMDSTITEGGQYSFQGGGMAKCDTTFNLTITIAVQDTTNDEVTICPNETITYQDAMIMDTGIYFINIPTAVCDSVVILNVLPSEECPCEGEFPNAFSPNGDMINDTYGMFEIEGGCTPLSLEDFNLVIFNRWGTKVFESNDVNTHWDGRCDGSDCISEVYLVTYSYSINGQMIQRNRDVTLVR